MPAPSAPTLHLLRHAQPLIAPGTCYGWLDVPADTALTAAAAARFAATLPAPPQALRYSPLQRCEQLWVALQQQAPHWPQHATPDTRLQEMHFGDWEGRTWDTIDCAEIDAWAQQLATAAPGGGETLSGMLERVHCALCDSWQHDSLQGTRDVVWVTHAGVVRCVQWLQHYGRTLPSSTRWQLPTPGFGEGMAVAWQDLAAICRCPPVP